jgi:hypothetical protein
MHARTHTHIHTHTAIIHQYAQHKKTTTIIYQWWWQPNGTFFNQSDICKGYTKHNTKARYWCFQNNWNYEMCFMKSLYTEYTKHLEHLEHLILILSRTPFCPQNSVNSLGLAHFDSNDSHSWLDVLWVVDHSWLTRKTVEREKQTCCSSWHKPVHLTPLSYPVQRHLHFLSCRFTLWIAHIRNPCLKA